MRGPGIDAEKTAFTAFERLVKERGLPQAIRSDNGASLLPTGCSISRGCRSGGCAWALASNAFGLVIRNRTGRHERMHLTLKKEATRPAGANLL